MSEDKAEEDKEKPEEKKDKRIGNKFWQARTKHGRDKIFSTKEILKESCYEYFEWCDDNPLHEGELVKFQGKATLIEVPKMRAMTITGLCVFLGITSDTWANYRKLDDFLAVITQVEEIMRTQKFEGACADLLNPNIIARDLGLVDKKEHDISVKEYNLVPPEKPKNED